LPQFCHMITLTASPWLRYLHRLRTEGATRGEQSAAIGLGLLIGCTPLYGLHFWICAVAGRLLGLNRLKLYLASNISNPLVAPFLVFTEVQAGRLATRGHFYSLSTDALRVLDPWSFAADLLVGSLIVGILLGLLGAGATWVVVGPALVGEADEAVIAAAAARYLVAGISAWEVANAKLRIDSVYREVLRRVPLPTCGRILDLGCGRGLMLAMLDAARQQASTGAVPAWQLHGIEYRPRIVRLARLALGEAAVVEQGDLAQCELPSCRVTLLFDVLHLLPEAVQGSLLDRVHDAMEPGGWLVIREADAHGGWRFWAVEKCNRAMAILQGRWRRQFHFRCRRQWVALLERSGFDVVEHPFGQDTPRANTLLVARRGG
jgi:uncharacterized protein (DUF2062 family)/SAM-dependent methyltransferase